MNSKPKIRNIHFVITIITSISTIVKKIFLDQESKKEAKLYEGIFETIELRNLNELETYFRSMTQHQCACLGRTHLESGNIVTKDIFDSLTNKDGYIARSKKFLKWTNEVSKDVASIFFIDYDFDDFAPSNFKLSSFEELYKTIVTVIPQLIDCQMLIRWSSSARIVKEDGTLLNDKTSMHLFFIAENVTSATVNNFTNYLKSSLCKHGYMRAISDKGQNIVIKYIFDLKVISPERIIFSSEPILDKKLGKKQESMIVNGGALDLEKINYKNLYSHTIYEQDAKSELKKQLGITSNKQRVHSFSGFAGSHTSIAMGQSIDNKLTNIKNISKNGENGMSSKLIRALDQEMVRHILLCIGYDVDSNYKFKIRFERTASASISYNGYIKDFGGDFSGNIVLFLEQCCGLTKKNAVKYILSAFNIKTNLKPSDYQPLPSPEIIFRKENT